MWRVETHILAAYLTFCSATYYDYYTGLPLTPKQFNQYNESGSLDICAIDIQPCDPTEWRRVDGSCNSLIYPVKGTFFEPLRRMLPADYSKGTYPRLDDSGNPLPLPRVVRNFMLAEGKSVNLDFTQSVPGFAVFMFNDIASVHDIVNFLVGTPNCCAHRDNYMCTVNIIPPDDPVHRFSGIDCMNLTRPLTHQYYGCTNDPIPSPIQKATAVFDLSVIYNYFNQGSNVLRSFEGGQLETEVEDGKTWPPNGPGLCPNNQPGETRCFGHYPNLLLAITFFVVWFVRHHNYIASELALVNPCWDDERLFQQARDINIACMMQMFLYEYYEPLLGRENMINQGLISGHDGFRDPYDPHAHPDIILEYAYFNRWFHVMQDATATMFTSNGTFIKNTPMVDLTFRTGMLAKDNNMAYLTQGHFRQPCKDIDYVVDPEISERGLPGVQLAVDITTSDLSKGRLLGLKPYTHYLKHCFGRNISTFDDLIDDVPQERIEILKLLYKYVDEIDPLAGVWAENLIEGGKLPRTFACVCIEQLKRAIAGDRHFYERPNRPHAFTAEQLKQVRRFSYAGFLCSVADEVYEVQRQPFFTISPENPVVSCRDIPRIDFNAWIDISCKVRQPPKRNPYDRGNC